MAEFRLETERLTLRDWRDEDALALLPMEQDARVMRFLGPLGDEFEARRLVAGQKVNQSVFGHCFWPVERRCDRVFLGFCGLNPGPKQSPIEGAVEIGWRLAHHAWGQGYAREAALACLDWAWEHLPEDEVLAMTVAANTRSWGLMERLGMTRRSDLDFNHPALAEDDPLRPHIVYSAARPS